MILAVVLEDLVCDGGDEGEADEDDEEEDDLRVGLLIQRRPF